MKQLQHILNADFAELEKLESLLSPALENVDEGEQGQILLAVHELCVNIIAHGYQGGEGTIKLDITRDNDQLSFDIVDDAPNAYEPPEDMLPPDPLDLPESGWGMFIIQQVMDELRYERKAGQNHWALRKSL